MENNEIRDLTEGRGGRCLCNSRQVHGGGGTLEKTTEVHLR